MHARERVYMHALICGLYYKNIMIVNDSDTIRVITEWRHNLEHHLPSYFTLLESS